MAAAAGNARMEVVRGAGGDALLVHLAAGQRVRAESDAAVSMSENVEVSGTVHGGILNGVRRALLGGESVFQQELVCRAGAGGGGGGDAVLAAPDPGALAIVPVSPDRGLVAIQGAFVACDAGVAVDAGLRGSSLLNGVLSQQGLFAVTLRGAGNAVVHGAGGLMEHALGSGEARRVDNGHLVAWSDSCSISASAGSGSILGSLTSGEGVMLLVRGPGTVWVQSHKSTSHGSRSGSSSSSHGRRGGRRGNGVQVDGVVGTCIGLLFTLLFVSLFVGGFGYLAYLTLFGDGHWEQSGAGSWSWRNNEGSSSSSSSYNPNPRYVDDGRGSRGGGRLPRYNTEF